MDGRATMAESRCVQESADAQLARGASLIRIDLRDCTLIDSTFSGTLLSLKRRLEERGGELKLVSPSPRALDLLRQMGLEGFYSIESTPREGGPWREVAPTWPRPEELRRMILEAHDELASVPGAAGTFGPVAEELRRAVRPCRP